MPVTGPLSHIDLSVGDPDVSIPFYAAFFESLGFRRFESDLPGFGGDAPRRAAWWIRQADGSLFGVEVRPASEQSRSQRHDRYSPGLHHLAFHAASREAVDRLHARVRDAGGEVLDPPADYSGRPGYGEGYYAVFFADPDGVKLEVVHEPATNP